MVGQLGDLEPVRRRSTVDVVADELRSAVMYGLLPPGSQLTEGDLAVRLGVSRGPLREAMQRLVQEGLLRSEPHRGLFVIDLDENDVWDIYQARLAVERTACQAIMRGNRGEAVVQLTEALKELKHAAQHRDRLAMSDADQAFHQTLVCASGSPRLERMAQTLLVETRMCLDALQDKYPEPEDLVEEHEVLVEAIANGNEPWLMSAIEQHMVGAVERLHRQGVGPDPLLR
jgi:DNA-binding GntR family transcriptional regulator